MTDVTGVSRTSSMEPSVAVGLDEDTLMTYCTAQLNDLNADIKDKLANQQQMREYKSRINAVKSEIMTADGAYTPEQRKQILTDLAKLIRDTPENTPNHQTLMDTLQAYRKSAVYANSDQAPGPPNIDGYLANDARAIQDEAAGADTSGNANNLDNDELKNLADKLDSVSDDVGKNAELDMLSLQDLVSKRQMAVQVTSQIMAKFAQSQETIANNIK
jgi:hypothetical protein